MSSESRTVHPDRPRGREAVRAALVAAADELFGERGPDRVSVREVAERANVNHALLHRHFGSKDQLLYEVLAGHAANFRMALEDAADGGSGQVRMFDSMLSTPAFVRIMAHMQLSGAKMSDWVVPNGGLARLLELMHSGSDRRDRLLAAAMTALSMGWVLFEDFLLPASSFSDTSEAAREEIRTLMGELLSQLDG